MGILSGGISNKMLAPIITPQLNVPIKPFPINPVEAWSVSPFAAEVSSIHSISDGSGVVVGCNSITVKNTLYVIDSSGSVVSNFAIWDTGHEGYHGISAVVTNGPNEIYCARNLASTGMVKRLNADGLTVWNVTPHNRETVQLQYVNGFLYGATQGGSGGRYCGVYCLDAETGATIWKREVLDHCRGLGVVDGVVFSLNYYNVMHRFDATTGAYLGSSDDGEPPVVNAMAVSSKSCVSVYHLTTVTGAIPAKITEWDLDGNVLRSFSLRPEGSASSDRAVNIGVDIAGHFYVLITGSNLGTRRLVRLDSSLSEVYNIPSLQTASKPYVSVNSLGTIYHAANKTLVRIDQV